MENGRIINRKREQYACCLLIYQRIGAKETIESLKVEISKLNELVEQGAGLTVNQEHSVNELLRVKEELLKERDAQLAQVVSQRNEITELLEKLRQSETEKASIENDIHHLKGMLDCIAVGYVTIRDNCWDEGRW